MTRETALRRIIELAAPHMPASENDDEQMYYLIGGIIANAQDALGALRDERENAAFRAMFRRGVEGLGRRVSR